VNEHEVPHLLAALAAGEMSLGDVAAAFRHRTWPDVRRAAPATGRELAEQRDPDVDVPGSYDEVTAAYDRGELTSEQYRVLSGAVAMAINADAASAPPATSPCRDHDG
jgi:hypothetical protein